MRKFIIGSVAAMAAALSPMQAGAVDSLGQNNDFYFDCSIVMVLSQTNMGTITVWFNNETPDFNSYMMDFYLPEGFTIEKNKRGNYIVTYNNDENTGKAFGYTTTVTDRMNEGFYRFVGLSMEKDPLETGDDWFFRFNIIAPEGWADKHELSPASVRKIEIASGYTVQTAKTHYMPDIDFEIGPQSILTGVENISVETPATDAEEVIYNLQGLRVERPLAPGIYIINGKKELVR